MKKSLFVSVLLGFIFFIATTPSYSQTDSAASVPEINSSQSKEENLKAEAQLNEDRKDDAVASKKEYEAKEKEARRVENDAADASKQAKKSVKKEKQAQKARKSAEKQQRKAEKAAQKSDNN